MADFVALVEAQLGVDRSDWRLGYHITRILKALRDQVRYGGWPTSFDDQLRLSLIPYLAHDAADSGIDWTRPGPVHGALGPLFEIDARAMRAGRGRSDLSVEELEQYVAESKALYEEHTDSRARMHNGEE